MQKYIVPSGQCSINENFCQCPQCMYTNLYLWIKYAFITYVSFWLHKLYLFMAVCLSWCTWVWPYRPIWARGRYLRSLDVWIYIYTEISKINVVNTPKRQNHILRYVKAIHKGLWSSKAQIALKSCSSKQNYSDGGFNPSPFLGDHFLSCS